MKYSLDWARNVVKMHHASHARVSYFLLCRTNITADRLALFLANDDARWELWKKAVHTVEKLCDLDEMEHSTTTQAFSAMDQIVENLAHTPPYALLTAFGFQPKLKKSFLEARAALGSVFDPKHPEGDSQLTLF